MKWRRVFVIVSPLVAIVAMTAVAYGAMNPQAVQILLPPTPTLPPVPQPHPQMEIIEANTEYITVWVKPISCTYTLVVGYVDNRYRPTMWLGAPITTAVPQGVPYTVRWEDACAIMTDLWGWPVPRPQAGQWANVTWRCTMVYPTWEHGRVSFATLLVEQIAPE